MLPLGVSITQKMKCEQCGHKFELSLSGIGGGAFEEPGHYFFCGMVLLVVALTLLVLQIFYWAGLCVVFAAMMIRGSFKAISDVISSACPSCKHTNPIYPWSM